MTKHLVFSTSPVGTMRREQQTLDKRGSHRRCRWPRMSTLSGNDPTNKCGSSRGLMGDEFNTEDYYLGLTHEELSEVFDWDAVYRGSHTGKAFGRSVR